MWSKQPGSEPHSSHSLHVTRVELLDFSHLLYLYKPQRQKSLHRASLVAQWLRICLLMQGTQVHALDWEDPTCRGATRPVSHNY